MIFKMKRRMQEPCEILNITLSKKMFLLTITTIVLLLTACDSDKQKLVEDFRNYEGLPEPFATCMAEEFIKAAPPHIVKQRIKLLTGDFTPTELEQMPSRDIKLYIEAAWDACGKRLVPEQEQK